VSAELIVKRNKNKIEAPYFEMGAAASRQEKSIRRLPVDRDASKIRDLKKVEEDTQSLQRGSIIKLRQRKKSFEEQPNESRIQIQSEERKYWIDDDEEKVIVDRMSSVQVCEELKKRGFDPFDGPRGRNAAEKKGAEELKKWDREARQFLKNLIQDKISPDLLRSLLLENDLDGFDLLLEQNADINSVDERGTRPIHAICGLESLKDISDSQHLERLEESLKFLISRNADLDVCNNIGLSPLVMCAQSGWYRGTALLLNHNANVELSAEGNFTPLFESAKGGHLDCLKLLIRSGANINVVAGNGMSPLWVAAYHGRAECVSYLLESKANPDLTVKTLTARGAAEINGHQSVIDIFDRANQDEFEEWQSEDAYHEFLEKQYNRERESERLRMQWERSPEKHCVHGLRCFTTDHEYICDVCEDTKLAKQVMYGCRICDWDICQTCMLKKEREKRESEKPSENLSHVNVDKEGSDTSYKPSSAFPKHNFDDDVPGGGQIEGAVRDIVLDPNISHQGSVPIFKHTDSGPDIVLSDPPDWKRTQSGPDIVLSDPALDQNDIHDQTDVGPDFVLSDVASSPDLAQTDPGPDMIIHPNPNISLQSPKQNLSTDNDEYGEPDSLSKPQETADDGEPDIIISSAVEDVKHVVPTPDAPDVMLSPVAGEDKLPTAL